MNETTQPSPDGPQRSAAGLNEHARAEAPGGPAASGGGLWRAAAKRTLS